MPHPCRQSLLTSSIYRIGIWFILFSLGESFVLGNQWPGVTICQMSQVKYSPRWSHWFNCLFRSFKIHCINNRFREARESEDFTGPTLVTSASIINEHECHSVSPACLGRAGNMLSHRWLGYKNVCGIEVKLRPDVCVVDTHVSPDPIIIIIDHLWSVRPSLPDNLYLHFHLSSY